MPRVIVFDVNETLLDLQALSPRFAQVFGDAAVIREWFAQLLQSALVATLIDNYSDFATIGRAALEMVAARRGVSLADEERSHILGGMRELPPHPEVRASLERLRDAGLRLATLTNSPPHVVRAQLAYAGLDDLFEQILSVEPVRRFKPALEPYHFAARELGVDVSELRLVAAHDWDVTGAMRAGCAAAFVARPGMVLNPLMEAPDIVGTDLAEVTERILEEELDGVH
ncbi:MAG: haloacid dehalogenase type II [Ardenticatenaceae bacterium]